MAIQGVFRKLNNNNNNNSKPKINRELAERIETSESPKASTLTNVAVTNTPAFGPLRYQGYEGCMYLKGALKKSIARALLNGNFATAKEYAQEYSQLKCRKS